MNPAGSRPLSAAPWVGLTAVVGLAVAAMTLPRVLGWNVHVGNVPPLMADLHPHVGPGTVPSLALAVLVVVLGPRLAERTTWPRLLVVAFLVSAAWTVSLATVDGLAGISRIFEGRNQYLGSARAVTDVGATLRGFIDRIPATAAQRWPVHVGGHPPAALLYFVLLVRVGLGSGLASGLVSIVIAATTPVAVLICLRRLGAGAAARRAAPLLAVGPGAVWIGVSADAVFAAVAAWGLCLLAVAATAPRRRVRVLVGAAAGLLLGMCVFLSYGLVLLGVLAVAVLVAARSLRVLPVALAAAVLVAVVFALAGFAWWQAYPVLVERYWAGIASIRPGLYWIWADLAVLAFSAGPVVGAGIGAALVRARAVLTRSEDGVVVVLTLAAVAVVVMADVSNLSRSEVERIWLPFVPWLLVGTALLSARWRRFGLAAGVLTGLAVEHLLRTAW